MQFVANPEAPDYEALGIYVPSAYLTATANGDGTYTAAINEQGALNGFTAQTAPLVFPVNTLRYAAQPAPTAFSYDEISSYLKAGFIYVAAGMRGKDNGYDANGALIATVWGQGHTGDSTANFIAWVTEVVQPQTATCT